MKRRPRRIVVKNYRKHLALLNAICSKYLCGYEVRRDGTAVVVID